MRERAWDPLVAELVERQAAGFREGGRRRAARQTVPAGDWADVSLNRANGNALENAVSIAAESMGASVCGVASRFT